METITKLKKGETRRLPETNAMSGIWVSSVGSEEKTAHLFLESYSEGVGSRGHIRLNPEGLRALAADLLNAATFIEDCQAQRAVDTLTDNTAAQ